MLLNRVYLPIVEYSNRVQFVTVYVQETQLYPAISKSAIKGSMGTQICHNCMVYSFFTFNCLDLPYNQQFFQEGMQLVVSTGYLHIEESSNRIQFVTVYVQVSHIFFLPRLS